MLRTRVLEIHWRILQWVCLRDVVSRISATLKSFPFITGMDASLLSKKEHALLGNYHRYSPHCWLCFPLFFLALTPCHFHCKDIRFLSGLVNKVLELRTVCCEAQPYLSLHGGLYRWRENSLPFFFISETKTRSKLKL